MLIAKLEGTRVSGFGFRVSGLGFRGGREKCENGRERKYYGEPQQRVWHFCSSLSELSELDQL